MEDTFKNISNAYAYMNESVIGDIESDKIFTADDSLSRDTVQANISNFFEKSNLEIGKQYMWKVDTLASMCGVSLEDFIKYGVQDNNFMMNYSTEIPVEDGNYIFKVIKTG